MQLNTQLCRPFLGSLGMLSWSIVYETSYTLPGHAGRILGLCSWWHHLDNDPDAVVFAIMTDRVTPLVVVGRMGGRWLWDIGPCGTLFPTYNYSIHEKRLTPFKTLSPFE
jgi:hypothetical protein